MVDHQNKKPIRILLLGATGAGKSSTANTILSASDDQVQTYFDVSQGSNPCTDESGMLTRDVLGQQVTIVDTPGAFNTKEDYKQIQSEIRAAIENSDEDFDAIILVTRMQSNSLDMTDEVVGVLDVVLTLLGDHFWENGVLLFTHGDNYEKILLQKRLKSHNYAEIAFEEFVQKNSLSNRKNAIGRYAKKLNFAVVRFDNNERTPEKRKKMVKILLDKISQLEGKGFGKRHLPLVQEFVPTPQHRDNVVIKLYNEWKNYVIAFWLFIAVAMLPVSLFCGTVIFAVVLVSNLEHIRDEIKEKTQ